MKIQYLFLLIGIPIGIYWTILLPPFQAPDEFVHFYRAFEVSEGHIISAHVNGDTGNYLPATIKEFEKKIEADKIPFHLDKKIGYMEMEEAKKLHLSEERIFFSFPSSAIYSPIPYIPQAIGIFIAKVFDLSIYNILLTARLFNLFAFIALTFYAIKIIPRLKICLFLLALMPMTLHQSASISGDALLFGVTFLMIAYICRLVFSNETTEFNLKDFFILLGLSVCSALAKPAYFLFFLMVFLIPVEKYKSKKLFWKYNLIISFVALASLFIWMTLGSNAPTPTDPVAQLKWILLNPFQYLKQFMGTFVFNDYFILQFFGVLGWLDTPIPFVISYLLVIFFSIAITSEKRFENENNSTVFRGLLLLGFFLLEVAIVITMLFLAWPQSNPKVVSGIQGRYFIPIFLIFAYGIYVVIPGIKKIPKYTFYIIVVIFSLIFSSYSMWIRFYP